MKYINKDQKYSSKDTSNNSTKLPAIYNKINWDALKSDIGGVPKVLDYGAGKYTSIIEAFLKVKGFSYFPFDPYNCSDDENDIASQLHPDIIVCSNVLNVIAEKAIISGIHSLIRAYEVPYFITIWDGNRSCIGGPTIRGYQRNETIDMYLYNQDEIIRKEVITMRDYKGYIK